jgi:hypothetical protein
MPKGDVERPAPGRRLVGPHVIELLPVVSGMGAELVDAVDVFDVKPFGSWSSMPAGSCPHRMRRHPRQGECLPTDANQGPASQVSSDEMWGLKPDTPRSSIQAWHCRLCRRLRPVRNKADPRTRGRHRSLQNVTDELGLGIHRRSGTPNRVVCGPPARGHRTSPPLGCRSSRTMARHRPRRGDGPLPVQVVPTWTWACVCQGAT